MELEELPIVPVLYCALCRWVDEEAGPRKREHPLWCRKSLVVVFSSDMVTRKSGLISPGYKEIGKVVLFQPACDFKGLLESLVYHQPSSSINGVIYLFRIRYFWAIALFILFFYTFRVVGGKNQNILLFRYSSNVVISKYSQFCMVSTAEFVATLLRLKPSHYCVKFCLVLESTGTHENLCTKCEGLSQGLYWF
jgi:hypothetical protein